MKKTITLLLTLCLVFALAACGSAPDPLEAIEGADAAQRAAIQSVLDECGIKIAACAAAEQESTGDELQDSIIESLLSSFVPYDITAEDGTVYRMTLSAGDLTVFSITDPDGDFVYGGFGK